MIILNAFAEVKEGQEAAFLALTKPLIEATRKEQGNHFYQMYRNDNQFVFIEYWQDQTAIDGHNASAHFNAFANAAGPLFAKPLRIETYTQ